MLDYFKMSYESKKHPHMHRAIACNVQFFMLGFIIFLLMLIIVKIY